MKANRVRRAARRIRRRLQQPKSRPGRAAVERYERWRFERNLRLLYDTLATTELRGRYWIRAGLLLGWAREGRIMRHDRADADFGFFDCDRAAFLTATAKLKAAGFSGYRAYRRNDGRATVFVFTKEGAHFDFVESFPADTMFQYFLYAPHLEPPQQLRCSVPAHGLADVRFLNRVWQRPEPYEPYLETLYGNWREPDPAFNYTRLGSIVERCVWTGSHDWLTVEEALPKRSTDPGTAGQG